MNSFFKFKIKKLWTYFPEILILAFSLICIYRLDLTWFNTHMARDLARSIEWLNFKPSSWLGPELGWEYKRLPGPFFFYILGLFWSLAQSIEGVIACSILFTSVCLFFLIKELKLQYSTNLVNLFTLLFVFSPVFIATSRNIWNPSLIIPFCSLIFLFSLKYNKEKKTKWILINSLVAFLGIQIHFSIAIPFIAFIVSLYIDKKHLKIAHLMVILFLSWLGIWLYIDTVPEFYGQLNSFYGSNNYLINRIKDFQYHLVLSLNGIQDYDLFNLLSESAVKLKILPQFYLENFVPFLNILFTLVFFSFLIFLIIKLSKKRFNFIEIFSILWLVIFILIFIITKHKSQLPYRYGLALYPIQFFLVCLAYDSISSKIKYFFLIIVSIISLNHVYFIFKFYQFQNILGRTHHTQKDNLEMTLKLKKFIYSLTSNSFVNQDPFMQFHGRSINKMRLKEFNWNQTIPYFMIYKEEKNKEVIFNKNLIDINPEDSWLFQLKNISELKENKDNPYILTELKVQNLPQNLVIRYFNNDSEILDPIQWNNSNLIIPLLVVTSKNKPTHIKIDFDINASQNKYLNLLIDDNDIFRFAYETIFKIKNIKINSKDVKSKVNYKGYFLVQNQYIFEINEPKMAHVSIELLVEVSNINLPNFSRIDLFTTPHLLKREELE